MTPPSPMRMDPTTVLPTPQPKFTVVRPPNTTTTTTTTRSGGVNNNSGTSFNPGANVGGSKAKPMPSAPAKSPFDSPTAVPINVDLVRRGMGTAYGQGNAFRHYQASTKPDGTFNTPVQVPVRDSKGNVAVKTIYTDSNQAFAIKNDLKDPALKNLTEPTLRVTERPQTPPAVRGPHAQGGIDSQKAANEAKFNQLVADGVIKKADGMDNVYTIRQDAPDLKKTDAAQALRGKGYIARTQTTTFVTEGSSGTTTRTVSVTNYYPPPPPRR